MFSLTLYQIIWNALCHQDSLQTDRYSPKIVSEIKQFFASLIHAGRDLSNLGINLSMVTNIKQTFYPFINYRTYSWQVAPINSIQINS